MLLPRPKPQRPRDGNQLAFQVVQESVAEAKASAARLRKYPIEGDTLRPHGNPDPSPEFPEPWET